MRTILTWRILGEDLVGTRHVPTPGRAGGLSRAPSVGILLLNPGSAPRSGNSDLSVRIGDRLALRGFPVFRFDLSGLGDSSGPAPADLDAYLIEVVNGRNDEATVALIERIQLECGAARVVVGGLCAAAFPSVRALGGSGAAPAGLILMEPNFRLGPEFESAARSARGSGPIGRGVAALSGALLAGLRREGRVARLIRPMRTFLRDSFEPALPKDANVPLIRSWQASLERQIPSLVVLAAGHETDRFMARILASMPARAAEMVSCVRVAGTNHLFTCGTGGDAALGALEGWMMENFGGTTESVGRRAEIGTARRSAS